MPKNRLGVSPAKGAARLLVIAVLAVCAVALFSFSAFGAAGSPTLGGAPALPAGARSLEAPPLLQPARATQVPRAIQPDPADLEAVAPLAGSIGGVVYLDRNGNGLRDAGELGLAGVSINAIDVPTSGQSYNQTLLTATRPDDSSFLTRYLTRLQVVDKAAADGFAHLLSGMGVKV